MVEGPVDLIRDGSVATVVLNRADKRNAMNEAMWRAIADRIDEAARDSGIKVVVMRGIDRTAFSAGADIAEFATVHASADATAAYARVVDAAYDAVARLEKPTIAMIQGACFGGGCALALCCDLRYADRTASFCIPPARLGLIYTLNETKRLADLVGPSKAKEMLMGAYVVEAEEALRIGLATRLFDSDRLEAETYGFARRMVNLSQATIRGVKLIMAEIADGATSETERTRRLVESQFGSPDHIEGRNAFIEKRKPRFGQG